MGTPESVDGSILEKTEDFESIRALALRSGLEDGTFDNIVIAYGYFADGGMVGCVALKQDGDRFSVEWLAVSEELRGRGIGSMLVGKIEAEARAKGADRIWALARVPRFFETIGFRRSVIGESEGARMGSCLRCSQYQKSCFPAVMVKDF